MKHRAFSPRAAVAATGIAAVLLVGGTTTGAVADVASASALSAQQATPTAPGAPTGLTAAPGNGTVTLSWSPPASDGGAAVEGYFIDGDGPAATVEVTPHVPDHRLPRLPGVQLVVRGRPGVHHLRHELPAHRRK
jgi:hypothetical protein